MTDYWIEPPALASVVVGSRSPQACSPPKPAAPTWAGVVLNAPTIIRQEAPRRDGGRQDIGKTSQLPVCGQYNVSVEYVVDPVAILHVRISGERPIEPQPVSLEDPASEVAPQPPMTHPGQRYLNRNVGGYFAFDLAMYVDLPRHPAKVEFMLEFGGHRSETKSFEWVPATPAKE